ncbi:prefoldin subunit alpha [Candidatus Pacearchaeota archaeon]|jgi:prefoldin alpha subunit|nr:prefoldin subunit alpha [Candidatus Pacearchaeota archaeon]
MSEEQAQALMQQMQALEAYMSDLLQKEDAVIKLLHEATGAIESMKALGDTQLETLVPVGMGAYVKATIQPNEKLLVSIGAGASLEQDKNSAINYVEERIKELEIVLQQLSAQKHEVAARLEQGQQQMNRILQASQSKQ